MAKLTQATVLRATLDNNPNKVFTVAELHTAIKDAGITDVFEVQVLGYIRVMASRGQALRGPQPNTFTSINYTGNNARGPKKLTTSQDTPVTSPVAPGATKQVKDTPPAVVIDTPKGKRGRPKGSKNKSAGNVITNETFTGITKAAPQEKARAVKSKANSPQAMLEAAVIAPKKRAKAGTLSQEAFMQAIEELFGCAPGEKSETKYAHCFQFSQVDCTNHNLDYLAGRCQTISNGHKPIWWAAIVNDVVNVGIYAQDK